MNFKIGILGAGSLAREAECYAKRIGYDVVHFFDGTKKSAKVIRGLPYCMGVGNPKVKRMILEQSRCDSFVSLYDPMNVFGVDDSCNFIGKGCLICPGVFLTVGVTLGDFVTLNINATIGHDCKLGNFTNVAPGANISGHVTIGEGCDIGTNAAIKEKLSICNDVQLGLNCGVVKNIVKPGIYIGTPAHRIK